MTPTIPLPALVRSVSLLMYPKCWVNELMLRSDGTVAGEAVALPPPPPQAMTTSPASITAGTSLANLNLDLSSLSATCCLLPGGPGARVRRQPGTYSAGLGGDAAEQSIAQAGEFVKRSLRRGAKHVRSLDKPRDGA